MKKIALVLLFLNCALVSMPLKANELRGTKNLSTRYKSLSLGGVQAGDAPGTDQKDREKERDDKMRGGGKKK
jgi:hypothetical protein